jgi:DNA-binding NarL/FixJ family response regulator
LLIVPPARRGIAKPKSKPNVVAAAAPARRAITLVLIEDNRLMREGLAALIHAQEGFAVLVASAAVEEALSKLQLATPDIVLIDSGLADHDSLVLAATIRAEAPGAKVVVMGLLPSQEDVAAYVRAGASGFIMKDASFEEFFQTLRAVADGAEVLPPALTTSLFTQIAHKAAGGGTPRALEAVRLTVREREVIDLLGEGLSNKEIAIRMQIATHTVKSHVHNVLEKLALHSRLEVAAFRHNEGPSAREGRRLRG